MRYLAFNRALLIFIAMLAASAPTVSAEEPYPYFRRTADSQASLSSSIMSSISDVARAGVHLTADRSEASPGDDVRYWIKTVNLYSRDLPQWKIAFFFDPNQMQILESGGGRMEGDSITFTVPAARSGEQSGFNIRVRIYRTLAHGEVVRTYASMIWDGTIGPACSKHELRIMGRPPVTGAGDSTGDVENLMAFLRPINSTSAGSPMPLVIWMAASVAGVAIGGILGRKMLFHEHIISTRDA